MKRKTINSKMNDGYDDAPKDISEAIDRSTVVYDLLPPPERLVMKKAPRVKVTMDFSKRDVKFFKERASKLGVSYQSMIRELVSRYVDLADSQAAKRR